MADNTKELHLPFYLKYTLISIGLVAFFFIMYIGKDIIVPIIFSTIFAIVLNPLVNWLHGKKIHRVLSILISLFVGLILAAGFTWFVVWQAGHFADSLPELRDKFSILLEKGINWSADKLNIGEARIRGWIDRLQGEAGKNTSTMIGQTLNTVGGVFAFAILMPVYIFTILYYKPLFLQFMGSAFPNSSHKTVAEILVEIKTLIQSYLLGLLIETTICATLTSVGLLIIGVKYAILFGILTGLLNLIPYIGIAIATAMPAIFALATMSPTATLWVLGLYVVVQFIDNQYVLPYIVASKVKVNAFSSLVVLLIGGALWGISGMFLAIPLTAILKVVFDRIEPLKPFGILLGDDMPDEHKNFFIFPKRKTQKKPLKSPAHNSKK